MNMEQELVRCGQCVGKRKPPGLTGGILQLGDDFW